MTWDTQTIVWEILKLFRKLLVFSYCHAMPICLPAGLLTLSVLSSTLSRLLAGAVGPCSTSSQLISWYCVQAYLYCLIISVALWDSYTTRGFIHFFFLGEISNLQAQSLKCEIPVGISLYHEWGLVFRQTNQEKPTKAAHTTGTPAKAKVVPRLMI